MLRASPVRRPCSHRGFCFAAALLFCLLPARAFAQSQDVAEAARREKVRKSASAKSSDEKKDAHVYTNEDLKRAQILTPEDRAQVEARKKNPAVPPGTQPTETLEAAAPKSFESLGEIARRYRRPKTAREAEQALKSPQRMPLPPALSQPALASPLPLKAQPLTPAAPPGKASRPALAPPPGRRDPFSRPTFSLSPALPSQTPPATTPASPRIASKLLAPLPPAIPHTAAPAVPLTIDPRRSTRSVPSSVPVRPKPRAVAPVAGISCVTVKPGDSLWKLARLHLGKGSLWRELAAKNPAIVDPHTILPDTTLRLPQLANQPSKLAARTPTSKIFVEAGDSLWKIATGHFGSGSAWLCLAKANPQLRDANRIYPGQELTIPASCRPMS
jgi:nucleoid-associated protein YgaU